MLGSLLETFRLQPAVTKLLQRKLPGQCSEGGREGKGRTHGLFPHGGLVGVAGGLVVVGEGDDGRTHAQDHGGVDLAVGVCLTVGHPPRRARILQVLDLHGNHRCLLLLCVYVFYAPLVHQLLRLQSWSQMVQLHSGPVQQPGTINHALHQPLQAAGMMLTSVMLEAVHFVATSRTTARREGNMKH